MQNIEIIPATSVGYTGNHQWFIFDHKLIPLDIQHYLRSEDISAYLAISDNSELLISQNNNLTAETKMNFQRGSMVFFLGDKHSLVYNKNDLKIKSG